MPVFSIPNKYGIGDFGKESYNFIDFLVKAKQSVWQILPLVQTGYGDSPYSSVSSNSFNPYFISPDVLKDKGLLNEEELKFALRDGKYIDYGELYCVRYPLLKKAFSRFDKKDEGFTKFVKSKKALDYALFMAIKEASGYKHFYHWEDGLKYRDKKALQDFYNDYKEEVLFWEFVQYEASLEWFELKKYANLNGVKIMGDMPLYMALDSVDVWTNPSLYKLDEYFNPKKVAGVPPDYFCSEGQLWGNPVYNYENHAKDGYKWWINRIKNALKTYDLVRIDHFRGLDRYYEVDATAPNAKVGEWVKVPSKELFTAIKSSIKGDRIIAEDLGIIDDGVRDLLKFTGYPGMKILSFAFNGDSGNLYLPKNITENSVCYTGTHDNDTIVGLINSFNDWDRNNFYNGVKESLKLADIDTDIDDNDKLINAVIELGFNSKSKLFILPMQDVLKFGSDYRINTPGVVSAQNWAIRFKKENFNDKVAKELKNLTIKYRRNK